MGDAANMVSVSKVDRTRSGGVYVPPWKAAQLTQQMDKTSKEYQRMMWDSLRKSLNGIINKVNAANINNIAREAFSENLKWGMGLFCKGIMKAQATSPSFTNVFACLVAIINSKMPEVGHLLMVRVITNFQKGYKRNDKIILLTSLKFIAHAINQRILHEKIGFDLLLLFLDEPTHDSVELSVEFIKQCGKALQTLAKKNFQTVEERLRSILHEGDLETRTQYVIEGLFAVIKTEFKDFPEVLEELDLLDEEDMLTHELELDPAEPYDVRRNEDYFRVNPNFLEDQQLYEDIKLEILGDDDDEEEDAGVAQGGAGAEDTHEEQVEEVTDLTEDERITLRRDMVMCINSSLDVDEVSHKLIKGPCANYSVCF